jgi:hypothetical protein
MLGLPVEIEPPNQMVWRFLLGANGVERMDYLLLMGQVWSILSRGWTLRHDLLSQGRLSPY